MGIAANILIGVVALLHVYFMVLEMVLWQKPLGLKTFGQTPQDAKTTAALAANQGLYNGFLAAGLLWSLFTDGSVHNSFAIFFLGCVIVAGAYGAATVSRRILYVQAVPAAIALVLVLLSMN